MSGNVERRTAGGLGLLGYQGVALDKARSQRLPSILVWADRIQLGAQHGG